MPKLYTKRGERSTEFALVSDKDPSKGVYGKLTHDIVPTKGMDSDAADWKDRAYGPGDYASYHGQQRIFQPTSVRPRSSKVDMLFSSTDSRVHVLPLLGAMENYSQHQFGKSIDPSDDLSEHSNRLASRLSKKGVLDFEPHDEDDLNGERLGTHNDSFVDWKMDQATSGGWEEHDPSTMKRARSTVRSVLRPKNAGPQFTGEQQQLPL